MSGINNPAYPPPFQLACQQCGHSVALRTHYRARAFCCRNCGAYHEYSPEQSLKKLLVFKPGKGPLFEVGTVLRIDTLDYVVINFLVKEETSYKTCWTEYTLFHPVGGSLTLSESDGHYNLMRPSRFFTTVLGSGRDVRHPDKGVFQLYSKYRFTIRHARGEFLYPLSGELPACNDYVNPPYLLTYERSTHESCWYEGEYVSHSTLKSWLQKPVQLPRSEGISPSQPYPDGIGRNRVKWLTLMAIGLLATLQILLSAFVTKPVNVSEQVFSQSDRATTKSYVSERFEITANHGAADVVMTADVSNSWLEADFTLVNETTGEQYYFSGVSEYYQGYEDGEHWTEGSAESTMTVQHLSAGRYHYNVTVTTDPATPTERFRVNVIQNVTLLQNFWIALLCLLVVPLYIYLRRKNFERRQWSNSDYSPFNTES